jgi:hypothetical protein
MTNGLVNYVLRVGGITIVATFTGCVAILLDQIVSKLCNAPDSEFESFLFGPITGRSAYWAFG